MSTGPRPVQFTRQSAERIAAVVRQAELTPFPGRALEFDPVANAQKKVFRVGSYSGAWPIGGENVVTLRGSTATLAARNLFFDLPDLGARNCAVAKDGTAWYLVQWQWNYSIEDVFVDAALGTAALTFTRRRVVVLGSDTAATVSIAISSCSTATATP